MSKVTWNKCVFAKEVLQLFDTLKMLRIAPPAEKYIEEIYGRRDRLMQHFINYSKTYKRGIISTSPQREGTLQE